MVAVLFIKLLSLTQSVDYIIQCSHIQTAFLHKLITFLISGSEFYLIHQLSKAALSSSMEEYPFTEGSEEIRLASSMASSVFFAY